MRPTARVGLNAGTFSNRGVATRSKKSAISLIVCSPEVTRFGGLDELRGFASELSSGSATPAFAAHFHSSSPVQPAERTTLPVMPCSCRLTKCSQFWSVWDPAHPRVSMTSPNRRILGNVHVEVMPCRDGLQSMVTLRPNGCQFDQNLLQFNCSQPNNQTVPSRQHESTSPNNSVPPKLSTTQAFEDSKV
jgi:hypothetical protein